MFATIEFLDQVRERLMQTYGDEISALLQKASLDAPDPPDEWRDGHEVL